ncbi:MAG TPA: hypothetical protein VFQ38_12780 [Longimicrobiales bacterium]|nr:hypothetical protein [Longimicrobiales bacterium]
MRPVLPPIPARLIRGALRVAAGLGVATMFACGDAGPRTAAGYGQGGGRVWEIARAEDRAAAPAALLAYVYGLHVVLLDGDAAFLGTTRLQLRRGADGSRAFTLGDGLTARLAPAGEAMELRFSSGETVPMREHDARAGSTRAATWQP